MNHSPPSVSFDSTAFRQIMGCFATGIAVVTAHDNNLGDFGLTINSLTSVSLEPPLLLFCLDRQAFLHPYFYASRLFAINILSAEQENVSRHFAQRTNHTKLDNIWDTPQQGCPILQGTLGWILCRSTERHEGGDHSIILGEVVDLCIRAPTPTPLLYFHGRYRELAAAPGRETSGARK